MAEIDIETRLPYLPRGYFWRVRKLISSGVAVIMAATLAGCASRTYDETADSNEEPTGMSILTRVLSDGDILECAYVRNVKGGVGFDCNWEGVTAERAGYSK